MRLEFPNRPRATIPTKVRFQAKVKGIATTELEREAEVLLFGNQLISFSGVKPRSAQHRESAAFELGVLAASIAGCRKVNTDV